MVRVSVSFFLVAAWAGVCVAPARAEDPRSCKQLDEILGELRQLRKMLDAHPKGLGQQPLKARIEVGDAPFLGSKEAPLTIVNFTDFQCSFCRKFHEQAFQDLKKHYIDTGMVRFYSMDLPVDNHQNALAAAQAGRCAGEQGRFWEMHHRMQSNPERLDMSDLVGYAEEIGLDSAALRRCVETGKYKDAIQQHARTAITNGATGTPAFVVGKSTPDGVDGELIVGALPFGVFERKLKELVQ